MDVQAFHRHLISIPSVSHEEADLASFVESFLRSHNVQVHRSLNNVWAVCGSGHAPRLLLCSHLDTVPPTSAWTLPPFDGLEQDGKRYGLGANDAKASCAAMTYAFLASRSLIETSGGTLILALVANEETGRDGLERIVNDLMPLDAAIIGEPNGMNICTAQKGTCVLHVTWKGQSAHAAHGSSDHALKKALPELTRLSEHRFERVDPTLGETTLEITVLRAGERSNVIPESVVATLDIRQTPQYSPEELIATVRSLAPHAEVSVYSDRRQAVFTPLSDPIVQAARRAQNAREVVGSKTASDWSFLKGVPAIKMGPGDTRVSHTPDEYIACKSIDEAVTLYTQTLTHYFQDFQG